MTAANISRWKAYLGSVGSPVTYTAVEECFEITGLGVTKSQEDVTNFDSPTGTREYIPGLSEGDEVTIRCNYLPAGTQQAAWMTMIDAGVNRKFRASYVGVSPNKTFSFEASPVTWRVVPNATGKNTVEFVVKISGSITRA